MGFSFNRKGTAASRAADAAAAEAARLVEQNRIAEAAAAHKQKHNA